MNLNQLIPSMSSMPYLVRDIVGKVTNAVMNYTDAEIKVIEATNDDSWGPHGKLMEDIAELTFSPNTYNEVMSMLWRRLLQDGRSNWRRVYKGCTLLIYLLKHGSHKVLHCAQDRLEELRMLEHVEYPNDGYRNTTKNVQLKLAELLRLIEDSETIESERTRAKELKSKYVGVSSKDWSFRSHQPESFYSGKNPPTDSHISGRWRSTNPGILDRITEVTERVREFVIDSRNSFKSGSDNESSEDECQQRNSSLSEVNDVVRPAITHQAVSAGRETETVDVFEDFAEFQEAEGATGGSITPTSFKLQAKTPADLLDFDKPEVQTSPKIDVLDDLFQQETLSPERFSAADCTNQTKGLLEHSNPVRGSCEALFGTSSASDSRGNNILDSLISISDESVLSGDNTLLDSVNTVGVDVLLSMESDLTKQKPRNFSGERIHRNGTDMANLADETASDKSKKMALAKLPNTWSDCLDNLNIDLETLALGVGQMDSRDKTPMGQMKLKQK